MAEYSLYFDDSGHPDDQPFVVAAGFVSTEARWLDFEGAWLSALGDAGLGSVFHMADFEKKSRKSNERGIVLDKLTDIIVSHTSATFSVILEMAAYRRVNDRYPLEECIGTPWAIAARTLAKEVNEWKKLHLTPTDNLLTFVEAGTKHRGDMEEAFRRDALGIPVPVPKETPAMQPADMMAWEAFYFAQHGTRRKSLAKLCNANELFEGICRENSLLHTVREVKLPLRSAIPRNVAFVYHSSPKRIRKRTVR